MRESLPRESGCRDGNGHGLVAWGGVNGASLIQPAVKVRRHVPVVLILICGALFAVTLDEPALALSAPDGEAERGLLTARQLVTTLFERYPGDPALSRAEALRQASLAVMDDSAKDVSGKALFSYAHPLLWAPYVVVGDGGR
jgi:hypothetical protein